MRPAAPSRALDVLWCALAGAAALLAGCAAPPPPAPPPAPANVEVPFEQAVAQATDYLIAQAQLLPEFAAKGTRRAAVLDPMLDASSGQQTAATQLLERRVSERLASNFGALHILPFQSANLARAQYLLTGTLTRALANRPKGSLLLNVALTDLKSGTVVAQAWALTRDEGLNNTPLPYYADSPVLVKDKVIDGYITTSATGAGKRGEAYYLERIAVATVINDATTLYNAERYPESLAQYRAAGGVLGGDQLRVLNGIYLASAKLGRATEAAQAFGTVVVMKSRKCLRPVV